MTREELEEENEDLYRQIEDLEDEVETLEDENHRIEDQLSTQMGDIEEAREQLHQEAIESAINALQRLQ